MIDNLDTEETNHTYIEPKLIYNEEEDKKDKGYYEQEIVVEDTDTETFKILNPNKGYAIKISITIYFYIFYLLCLL